MAAPEVVEAVGMVHPQTASGNPPPMATSRIKKNPWSTAAYQAAAPTWFSLTVKYARPSRYQVIDSLPVFVRFTMTE